MLQKNGKCVQCSGSTPYSTGTECTSGCVASSGSFCDSSGTIKACAEKYGTICTSCNNNECTGCRYSYYLLNKQCHGCNSGCAYCDTTGACTSCWGSSLFNPSKKTCDGAPWSSYPGCNSFSGTTESYQCSSCNGGYYLNSSNTCTTCELTGCSKCQNGQSASNPKCTECLGGYYMSDGNCISCSTYDTNCASCDSTGCLSCKQNYALSDDKKTCESTNGAFKCSDENFMKIGNLCITRKNMGDSVPLSIPAVSGLLTVQTGGDTCYSDSSKCCWQGKTGGGSCNSNNGGYSGCNRTVCNFEAANAICANFNYAGKKWRLAKYSEAQNWGAASMGLGTNGLQLCDYSANTTASAGCDNSSYNCKTYSDQRCLAHGVWVSEGNSMQLSSNSWSGLGWGKNNAFSVRCVTEMND